MTLRTCPMGIVVTHIVLLMAGISAGQIQIPSTIQVGQTLTLSSSPDQMAFQFTILPTSDMNDTRVYVFLDVTSVPPSVIPEVFMWGFDPAGANPSAPHGSFAISNDPRMPDQYVSFTATPTMPLELWIQISEPYVDFDLTVLTPSTLADNNYIQYIQQSQQTNVPVSVNSCSDVKFFAVDASQPTLLEIRSSPDVGSYQPPVTEVYLKHQWLPLMDYPGSHFGADYDATGHTDPYGTSTLLAAIDGGNLPLGEYMVMVVSRCDPDAGQADDTVVEVLTEPLYTASSPDIAAIRGMRIVGPDYLVEGEQSIQYHAIAQFLDVNANNWWAVVTDVTNWGSLDSSIASIGPNDGKVNAKLVDVTETTELTASYLLPGIGMIDSSKMISVVNHSGIAPVSVEIVDCETGSLPMDMNELSEMWCCLHVMFADGTDQKYLGSSSNISFGLDDDTYASMSQDGLLIAHEVDTEQTITIYGQIYWQGKWLPDTPASADITIFDSSPQPVGLEIIDCLGGTLITQVYENDGAEYCATLLYDDGSSVDVTFDAVWDISDDLYGYISSGSLITDEVTGNQTATISAMYYVDSQPFSDTLDITIIDIPQPTDLRVEMVPSIYEGNDTQARAFLVYDDGSEVEITTDQYSTWTSAYPLVADVSGTGMVSAAEVDNDDMTIITCFYYDGEHSLNKGQTLQVLDIPPAPVSVSIIGPTTVAEFDTQQYTATLEYDDGSTVDVTQNSLTNWHVDPPDGSASIDNAGVLTADGVDQDTTVTVSVSYGSYAQEASIAAIGRKIIEGPLTDYLDVTIVDVPVPVMLNVAGPVFVDENSSASYTAQLVYSNGSTDDVTADPRISWWVTPGDYAQIDQQGLLQTGDVAADQGEIVSARIDLGQQSLQGQLPITVVYVGDPPPAPEPDYSLIIEGPARLDEASAYDFTARLVGTNELGTDIDLVVTNLVTWRVVSAPESCIELSNDTAGQVITNQVSIDRPASIEAILDYNGQEYTADKNLVVVDLTLDFLDGEVLIQPAAPGTPGAPCILTTGIITTLLLAGMMLVGRGSRRY